MTNILRAPMLDGFEQRAASVLNQCEASRGGYLDVYVCVLSGTYQLIYSWTETDSRVGHSALLCFGLRLSLSIQPRRNRYSEQRGRLQIDARAIVSR